MKLNTLTLAGIGTFSQPTTIDLTEPLYAICGPTGAGKTTILDGIMVALYGRVPRYGGRALAPVITSGVDTASVTLTFTLDGRRYEAVRKMARTRTGATTREARLTDLTEPSAPEVLADDATGVSDTVANLLGLDADQFAATVVLPQGEYARLLTDTPAARQQLLIGLLGMERWRDLGRAARREADLAEGKAAQAKAQRDAVGDINDVDVTEAEERLVALQGLTSPIADAAARHADLTAQADTAASEAAAASAEATVLDGVSGRMPDLTAAAAAGAARRAATGAEQEVESASTSVEAARAALQKLPTVETFKLWRSQLDAVDEARSRHAAAEQAAVSATAAVPDAESAVEAARSRVEAIEQQLADARAHDTVAAAAASLHVGDDCPLCPGTVTEASLAHATRDRDEVPDPTPARQALTAAERSLAAAIAESEHTARTVQTAAADLARAQKAAADVPAVEEITAAAGRWRAANDALKAAESRLAEAKADARRLRAEADRLTAVESTAWTTFDEVRDSLGRFGPPPVDREDLSGSVGTLVAWASTEADGRRESATTARDRAQQLTEQAGAAVRDAAQALADVDLSASGRDPRDVLVEAISNQSGRVERLRMLRDTSRELRDAERDARKHAEVLNKTATHLSSRGFEQWLLEEVMGAVADAASATMQQLTGGRLALDLDGGEFQVVDLHRSHVRAASSLSGGETFLASVALALALPEQVRLHGHGTAASLDTLLIDEGFGALDGATLEVVAEAIERLASTGKSVGVVTHVEALAARMPSRIVVQPTSTGSRVARDAA